MLTPRPIKWQMPVEASDFGPAEPKQKRALDDSTMLMHSTPPRPDET